MAPVRQRIAFEDQTALRQVGAVGDVRAVEPPAHAVEDARAAADRERQGGQERRADPRAAARPLGVQGRSGQPGAEREGGEDERGEDAERRYEAEEPSAPRAAARRLRVTFLGVHVAGPVVRGLRRRSRAEPLDLVDEKQDRATGRAELGVRLVTREALSPGPQLGNLSCIHAQSMTFG